MLLFHRMVREYQAGLKQVDRERVPGIVHEVVPGPAHPGRPVDIMYHDASDGMMRAGNLFHIKGNCFAAMVGIKKHQLGTALGQGLFKYVIDIASDQGDPVQSHCFECFFGVGGYFGRSFDGHQRIQRAGPGQVGGVHPGGGTGFQHPFHFQPFDQPDEKSGESMRGSCLLYQVFYLSFLPGPAFWVFKIQEGMVL